MLRLRANRRTIAIASLLWTAADLLASLPLRYQGSAYGRATSQQLKKTNTSSEAEDRRQGEVVRGWSA